MGRGFTLLEMIVVIVVLGIVATAGAVIIGRSFPAYFGGQDITRVDWQGRVALERMTREIRDIRSATAADLITLGASTIRFVDIYANDITYALVGTTLNLTQAPNPATPLADNVTALTFTYLDRNGAVTAVAANVYYISVALTVTAPGTTVGTTVNYRDSVKPRNFS